jgi:hypothetical protein
MSQMVSIMEEEDPDTVNHETQYWNLQKPSLMINHFWVLNSLYTFKKYIISNKNQEYSVKKATQDFNFCISKSIFIISFLQLPNIASNQPN